MSEDNVFGFYLRCTKCGHSRYSNNSALTDKDGVCEKCGHGEICAHGLTDMEYNLYIQGQCDEESSRSKGLKFDSEKLRMDLIPPIVFTALGTVLTFGAKKYGQNSWQKVENAVDRYYAALLRHIVAWREGHMADDESGLSHLWHALCCLVFLIWFEFPEKGEENASEQ